MEETPGTFWSAFSQNRIISLLSADEGTMVKNTTNTPRKGPFRGGRRCIQCGTDAHSAKYHWSVTSALQCTLCHKDKLQHHRAWGIVLHMDCQFSPTVPVATFFELESKAKIVQRSAVSGICRDTDGVYYPDGHQITSTHLPNSHFTFAGPNLPPFKHPAGSASTITMREVATKTSRSMRT